MGETTLVGSAMPWYGSVHPGEYMKKLSDKKSLSDGRSIGESGVVCQGKTRHSMLRTGGLRWTRAFLVVWSGVKARGSKPEIC